MFTVLQLGGKFCLDLHIIEKVQNALFVPHKDHVQAGRLSSLIRVFTVCMKKKLWPWAIPSLQKMNSLADLSVQCCH